MFYTIALLIASNVFMTFAWYGHLKYKTAALWLTVLASWGIAFFVYCLQVPANRIGHNSGISGAQLKTIQEVITLAVFVVFAVTYLKEPLKWNVVVGFVFVAIGAAFVFEPWNRAAAAAPAAAVQPAQSANRPD
jgi:uncharacterized protein (DUF486 family)